jgi:hypothetical protein
MTEHRSLAIKDLPVQCRWCKEPWPCETEILRRRVKSLESAVRYDPENTEILINGERVIMSNKKVIDPYDIWVKIALADSPENYSMAPTVELAIKNFVRMRLGYENN